MFAEFLWNASMALLRKVFFSPVTVHASPTMCPQPLDAVQFADPSPWLTVLSLMGGIAVVMMIFLGHESARERQKLEHQRIMSGKAFVNDADTVRSEASRRNIASRPTPPPLKASDHVRDGKYHLLLCATGSVATIKIPNIITAITNDRTNISIRVLLTSSASEFLASQASEQPSLATIAAMPCVDAVYLDTDEWRKPWVRGDNILHIELRRWADIMVIAPLSANSLAKVALGISDNLITSVVRAWDTTGLIDGVRNTAVRRGFTATSDPGEDKTQKKRIIVAPAMNTAMWNHPVTAKHMRMLEEEWGTANGGWIEVLRPVEKSLACGDTGSGAMREWKDIVRTVEERLGLLEQEEDGDESMPTEGRYVLIDGENEKTESRTRD